MIKMQKEIKRQNVDVCGYSDTTENDFFLL